MTSCPVVSTWTRYRKLQTIGAGSFGQVFLVEGGEGGEEGQHVIKRVQVAELADAELKGAINEVQVLSLLDHPNVVGYRDHFVDTDGYLNIVMEHCSQGDLSKCIDRLRETGSHFSQEEIAFYAFQLMQGMKYIHSIDIIHRDLKPANIFLTRDNTLKIADFGISKLVSTSSVAQSVVGTPYYIAPEICESQPYTNKADIWSAGCVLYELAALEKPFTGTNILAVVRRVTDGVYTPLKKRYTKLSRMVRRMLVIQPEDRATVSEIIEEFYTGIGASLPSPEVDGLGPKDIRDCYANWAVNLDNNNGKPVKGRGKSPRTSKSEGGSPENTLSGKKKSKSGTMNGTGGSKSDRKKSKPKIPIYQVDVPEVEYQLLPSKCMLVEGAQKRPRKRQPRQPTTPPPVTDSRPHERSGKRPHDSFAKMPSLNQDGSSRVEKRCSPPPTVGGIKDRRKSKKNLLPAPPSDTYSDDSFEDDYSNDSFEQYTEDEKMFSLETIPSVCFIFILQVLHYYY